MGPPSYEQKVHAKAQFQPNDGDPGQPVGSDLDVDLSEVYFLIMHFLSAGPCQRTFKQFWSELREHQLLPRRYHAWYSRSGEIGGNENDNGSSFPLTYDEVVQRY